MSQPRIPINQQNAFPLQTLDASINGGTVTIVGNRILRYFGPNDIGISAVPISTADPFGGTRVFAFGGSFLDVSGCDSFGFILHRQADSAAHDTAQGAYGVAVIVIYRDQGTQSETGSVINTSCLTVNNVTTNPSPAGSSYPNDQLVVGFALSNYFAFTGNSNPGWLIGNSFKLALQASAASATGMTFSLSMWAQG